MTENSTLSPQTIAQFRWLVAALRNEAHADSRDHREDFARRLEQALVGADEELAMRLGGALTGADGSLLVTLARWHEDAANLLSRSAEQSSHRGRAHRYREISQIMRIWV